MTKKRRSKSSKAANLARRIVMIANGMRDAGPKSPSFELRNGKLIKVFPQPRHLDSCDCCDCCGKEQHVRNW
jgi:hypothetical protein